MSLVERGKIFRVMRAMFPQLSCPFVVVLFASAADLGCFLYMVLGKMISRTTGLVVSDVVCTHISAVFEPMASSTFRTFNLTASGKVSATAYFAELGL